MHDSRHRMLMLRQVLLLALVPIISSLSTMILVPIAVHAVGPAGWFSVASGQALGALANIIVIWGWNAAQISIISGLDFRRQIQAYHDSVLPRCVVLICIIPLIICVCCLLPGVDSLISALNACGAAIGGLTANWFYIASDRAKTYVICESIPMSIVQLSAAALLFSTGNLVLCSVLLFLAPTVSILISYLYIRKLSQIQNIPWLGGSLKQGATELRIRLPIMGASLLSTALQNVLTIGASVLMTNLTGAIVALADKLGKWTMTALTPILQVVSARAGKDLERTRNGVFVFYIIIGVFSLASVNIGWFALPWVAKLISLGEVAISPLIGAFIGGIVSLSVAEQLLGKTYLVAFRRLPMAALSAGIALTITVFATIPLVHSFQANGAMLAVILGQIVDVFILVLVIAHSQRQ